MSLVNYMYMILKQKYQIHENICDYAYNFLDALDKYSDDPDCSLFLHILNGIVSEQLYKDQFTMTSELEKYTTSYDNKIHHNKIKHRLLRKELQECLCQFFMTKSDENLKQLNYALIKTDNHNEI